jgi:hypothetical protein
VLEIETQEKTRLREEMHKLAEEKELFYKRQIDSVKTELFELRARNHLSVNEVMRLYNIILGLQRQMAAAHLPIEEIAFVPLTQLVISTVENEQHAAEEKAKGFVEKSGHGD